MFRQYISIFFLIFTLAAQAQADYIFQYRVAEVGVELSPPTVNAISPSSGPISGGNTVTIIGDSFTGSSVLFGATPADVLSVAPKQIQAVAPAHTWGPVAVTVTNNDGKRKPLRVPTPLWHPHPPYPA